VTKSDPGAEVRKVLGDTLESPPPQIDGETAVALLKRHYGIEATAKPIACERDATFQMKAVDGTSYTLKIANPAEPPLDTNFQTEALRWVDRVEPALPVPKMVPARDGRFELSVPMMDGRASVVRLLSWLDGVPVAQTGVSAELRCSMGQTLARLGVALRGFDHPRADHDIQWDIKNASRLRPLIAALPDTPLRRQLGQELDHFDAVVKPALAGLRWQVVHNDFNLHNVLTSVDDPARVSGVLDFGDMVKTPLVIDLAVAAAYMTHLPDGALRSVTEIVAAYHQVAPLHRAEILLLRDLIVVRLVTTIAITEWRAARYPQNATYILRNNGPARIGLERFATLPGEDVTATLLRACEME
jgi:Ser/Thr protein kinase RdoA (MazF antagonist)